MAEVCTIVAGQAYSRRSDISAGERRMLESRAVWTSEVESQVLGPKRKGFGRSLALKLAFPREPPSSSSSHHPTTLFSPVTAGFC